MANGIGYRGCYPSPGRQNFSSPPWQILIKVVSPIQSVSPYNDNFFEPEPIDDYGIYRERQVVARTTS